jgi:hypothetical protein
MSDSIELPTLRNDAWTPIAFRPRMAPAFHFLQWIPVDGAPIDTDPAHKLH